jgi:haloalkane dehalogenase
MNRRNALALASRLLPAAALGVCGGGFASARDAAKRGASLDSRRRFARTRFGDIAYLVRGGGRAALFLHGFPLNAFQWRGALELLAPYRLCLAPDFLDLGHSRTAPGQDVGPESQADMLASLLDALGIADADVIANDSGGAVAQLLLVRHPQRIRTLLLTNCDTELESPPAAMQPVIELAGRGRFVDEWIKPWAHDPRLARSERGIGGLCYTDCAHPTDEALQMYFGPLLESSERVRALHRYAISLKRNALAGIRRALEASRVPTRIVWGADDTIFSAKSAHYLASSFGNSRGLRLLKQAKLFWPEERPEILAAQARRLWESARAHAPGKSHSRRG